MTRPLLLAAVMSISLPLRVAHADAAGGAPVFIEDTPPKDPHDDGDETYLTLGVISAPTGGWAGLRAQIDAFSAGHWSFGAAGTLFGCGMSAGLTLPVFEASGVAYLAFTAHLFRNINLRAQVGYGARATVQRDTTTMTTTTTRDPILDASAFVIGRGTHNWSILGGPIVQRSATDTTVMLFFGLQRRF